MTLLKDAEALLGSRIADLRELVQSIAGPDATLHFIEFKPSGGTYFHLAPPGQTARITRQTQLVGKLILDHAARSLIGIELLP